MRLFRLFKSEILKLRVGRAWWIMALSGALMSLITSYGYADLGRQEGTAGSIVTGQVVRAWMMVYLFSSLFAATIQTRDAGSGGLARSILVARDRRDVVLSRFLASIVSGMLFGILSLIGAYLSVVLIMPGVGVEVVWNSDALLTLWGVFLCSVIAAPFGMFIGMLIRNTSGAVSVIVFLTLLVEPMLQRLVPYSARFLFTIALSSVYRDGKPELFTMPIGFLVASLWVVAVGAVATWSMLRRDVT